MTTELTQTDHNVIRAAYWLLGVNAAFNVRGFPGWLDRSEFFANRQTAHEVLAGGTYRGPLVCYALIAYVEKISCRLTPPLRLTDARGPRQ